MTTLAHLATNIFIITRLTSVSGHIKDYTTTTGIKATLQPVSPEKANLFNGVIGKTFIIYADGVIDLQEGDKLRDTTTSEIYKVVNGGVSRRSFGSIDHLQVIIELVS